MSHILTRRRAPVLGAMAGMAVLLALVAAVPGRAQDTPTFAVDGPVPATGAGGVIEHVVIVTNTGTVSSEVALLVEGGAWEVTVPDPVTVEPEAGAALTILVHVPHEVGNGAVDEARLQVVAGDTSAPFARAWGADLAGGTLVAERTLASWTGGRVAAGRWFGCRFDLDGSGQVDATDTGLVAAAFGRRADDGTGAADPHYDAALDLNGDGRIGAGDVQTVAGAEGQECGAPTSTDTSAAREAMDAELLETQLDAFQQIADDHDGNRAIGTSGYEASADHVATELERLGWVVTRQRNNFPRTGIGEAILAVPGETLVRATDYDAFGGGPSMDVTGTLVAVDLVFPPSNDNTSGCEAEDFAGFPTGGVALIQRGGCNFRVKIDLAADAGAVAAVVFNTGTEGRTDLFNGNAGSGSPIPAMRLTYEAGARIAARLAAGEELLTRVAVEITVEDRFGDNIIAEWPHGDPDRFIMAGAHLDSVPAGAGLNDNATGSSGLLVLAEVIAEAELRPRHTIRLAWWAAEEIGLLGSARYVSTLPPEERAKILSYLNFDMIGSINYIRAIYDGDGSDSTRSEPFGSGELEWAFQAHFDSLGLAHEPIGDVIYRRSDHASFSEAGIPVAGLFSGFNQPKTAEQAAKYGGQEGASADPCYHRTCDDIDNVNVEGLEIMADAIAHSVLHYAEDPIFPLATGRAYPLQQPGAGALSAADGARAEEQLRSALAALSVEGGCAAAWVAHEAEVAAAAGGALDQHDAFGPGALGGEQAGEHAGDHDAADPHHLPIR